MERIAYRSERTAVATPQVAERSLSQKLVELHTELNRLPESAEKVYDRLFALHLGEPSRRKDTPRNRALLERAQAWCAQHRVSFADYISANLILLRTRGWSPERKSARSYTRKGRTFRVRIVPSWLLGAAAERRYNGVLGRANRRYQTGSTLVFPRATWIGCIRENLFYAEFGAGELFVSLRLAGDPITWEEAVALTTPNNPDWSDFQRQVGRFTQLVTLVNQQRAVAERDFARLRAAWSVAQRVQPGLADRIGFTEFSWPAFADILAYATEDRRARRERNEIILAGGRTWGNW